MSNIENFPERIRWAASNSREHAQDRNAPAPENRGFLPCLEPRLRGLCDSKDRLPQRYWPFVARRVIAAFALVLIAGSAFGQGRGIIGGHTVPQAPRFSPGQIGTIYVFGVDEDLYPPVGLSPPVRKLEATSLPLPTELGGISVLARMGTRNAPLDVKAPILSIRQCCTSLPIGLMITFQWPGPPPVSVITSALLVVVAKGVEIASEGAGLIGQPRILSDGCPATSFAIPEWGVCDRNSSPIITHADGTLVRSTHPASSGETLVVYAVGLGLGYNYVPFGVASPFPAVDVTSGVLTSLDFAYDGGRNPRTERLVRPDYAGLTPGAVGLYQIHVTVPEIPAGTLPCTRNPSAPVASNLSITIRTRDNDRIGVCVEPPDPTGKASLEMRTAAPDAPRFDPIGFPIGYPGAQ